jgi:hypothetical protein
MTTRRATAVAGCAVLGAAMVVVGTGPAAATSDDHGAVRTVEGYGVGSLSAPDAGLGVLISLFGPPDRDAFAGVEIFGSTATTYYECFEGPTIDAEIEGVREAEAEGRTKLLCGGPDFPSDVVAYVTVDLEWDGVGPVAHDRYTFDGCRVKSSIRQAEVTGRVKVSIPALDIKAYLTEGVGDLRRITSICPDPQG